MIRWRTTLWLLALTLTLFAFIMFVERQAAVTDALPVARRILPALKAGAVTSLQLQRTNQHVLRTERVNGKWMLTSPIHYPAQPYFIEALLQALEKLAGQPPISLTEINPGAAGTDAFGLEPPLVTLALQQAGQRMEIQLGAKTPAGDQVYAQVLGAAGIYVVPAELFDHLPYTANDWRDNMLLNAGNLLFDRLSVSNTGGAFMLLLDSTNQSFNLVWPIQARADKPRILELLRRLGECQIAQFVSDNPRAELEPYGLRPPEIEVTFSQRSNDVATVQFGKSPATNDAFVYARRLSHTNIVLVPRAVADALRLSHTEVRDPLLLSFNPAGLEAVEARGREPFVLRRQTNGTWLVTGTNTMVADAGLVQDWLNVLSQLRISEFVRDFVTDLAPFGLTAPVQRYTLKTAVTNASGVLTNSVVAQLDFGAIKEDRIYVRRSDENSVYAVPLLAVDRFPTAGWQLRDRRVWSFATNQVARITVQRNGRSRSLARSPAGDWKETGRSGSMSNPLDPNPFSLEDTLDRLSQLKADAWHARGAEHRQSLGFTETGHKLTIELKGEKPQTLKLEFGARAPSLHTRAAVEINGEPWFFEFPIGLGILVKRDLDILTANDATP